MALDSTSSLLVLATTAAAVAAWLFARNLPNYLAISRAVAPQGLHLPEAKLGYGANYLNRFVLAARAAKVRGRTSASDLYVEPTLRTDGFFAIAFAATLVLLNVAIAPLMPLHPFGRYLALSCAVMAAAYGVCDVLENGALKRILQAGPDVDSALARRASLWTMLKFVTLFSVCPAAIGLLAKLGHDHAYDVFYRVLKLAPLAVLVVACFRPPLARVLWACRVSIVSALAGYYLFLLVVQAQDLFADTMPGVVERRFLDRRLSGGRIRLGVAGPLCGACGGRGRRVVPVRRRDRVEPTHPVDSAHSRHDPGCRRPCGCVRRCGRDALRLDSRARPPETVVSPRSVVGSFWALSS